MPSQAFINSAALILLTAVMTFMATAYWQRRGRIDRETERKAAKLAEENKQLMDRVLDMEKQLGMLNQAVLPISTAFQAILIKELTHFHTPEMDALMVKIGPPNTLSDDEMTRLEVLLEERTRDMATEIPESERDAAHMLPYVMKRAKMDLEAEKKLQLVSVPPQSAGGEQEQTSKGRKGTTPAHDAVTDKKQQESGE